MKHKRKGILEILDNCNGNRKGKSKSEIINFAIINVYVPSRDKKEERIRVKKEYIEYLKVEKKSINVYW